ncbi:unnamed protein product [Aureobasidium pullulans]|nr:unnamed protein product [Aureobasidium pullulans]
MADVRSLLRNERASRRINHPHATYSDSGKLLCAVCNLQIKTESLWDNHVKSPQHTARLEYLRANPPPPTASPQTKKRKAGESDDEGRKRVKAVPGGFVPEGFFDAAQEDEDQHERTRHNPPHLHRPPAPDVDEDEWAAFEREMAATQQNALPIISASATISAAPVSAEELAAQAREEQSAQRTAREAEIEADTEDAALAMQQEFDEMEELDERVRRLHAPASIPEAVSQTTKSQNDNQEEDEDDDDEDDDFDDWTLALEYLV